jgi:hypothetical protein
LIINSIQNCSAECFNYRRVELDKLIERKTKQFT